MEQIRVNKEIFDSNKGKIVPYIMQSLAMVVGSAEGDMVEYISIMLSNGKTVQDINEELKQLLGDDNSKSLCESLCGFMKEFAITPKIVSLVSVKQSAAAATMKTVDKALSCDRQNSKSNVDTADDNNTNKLVQQVKQPFSNSNNRNNSGITGVKTKVVDASGIKRLLEDGMEAVGVYNSSNSGNKRLRHNEGKNQMQLSTSARESIRLPFNQQASATTGTNLNSIGGSVRGGAMMSEADKLAQMNGFANAQEMLIIQQQQIINLMQHQQQGMPGPPPLPHQQSYYPNNDYSQQHPPTIPYSQQQYSYPPQQSLQPYPSAHGMVFYSGRGQGGGRISSGRGRGGRQQGRGAGRMSTDGTEQQSTVSSSADVDVSKTVLASERGGKSITKITAVTAVTDNAEQQQIGPASVTNNTGNIQQHDAVTAAELQQMAATEGNDISNGTSSSIAGGGFAAGNVGGRGERFNQASAAGRSRGRPEGGRGTGRGGSSGYGGRSYFGGRNKMFAPVGRVSSKSVVQNKTWVNPNLQTNNNSKNITATVVPLHSNISSSVNANANTQQTAHGTVFGSIL